jgi:hypothetical protein
MTTWKEEIKKIEKCNQRQDSIKDQMIDLIEVANKLGFYDASDYIRRTFLESR